VIDREVPERVRPDSRDDAEGHQQGQQYGYDASKLLHKYLY
jgi:hypothetical protein